MRFLSNILAKAGLVVDGTTTLNGSAAATVDTDRFAVLDGFVVKYRTGAELLSDIGAQAALTNPITGTGTAGQVAYWSGTNTQTGSSTLTYTPTSALLVNNSVTAATSIARGINITPTLVAAANSDVLIGLDVSPTFTNGAFTGLSNLAARLNGMVQIRSGLANNSGGYALEVTGSSGSLFYVRGFGDAYLTGSTPILYIGSSGTNISSGTAYIYSNQATDNVFFTIRHNNNNQAIVAYSNGKVTLQESGVGNVIVGSSTDSGLYKMDVVGPLRSTSLVIQDPLYSGTISIYQSANNTSRIYGGPQEYISMGPDNGIRLNTNLIVLNAAQTKFAGAVLWTTGQTFSPDGFSPAVGGTKGIVFSGNYTNIGAGGTYGASAIVAGFDIATAIGDITLNQFAVENTINTTAGTTIHRGFYYNPTLTSTTGLTNIAFESTSGLVKVSDLSGTGTRMVVANALGVLSTQAIPSGSSGGTLNLRSGQTFTATASQTVFTTTPALSSGNFDIYLNGVRLNTSSYTFTSSSFTLSDGAASGDILDLVTYLNGVPDQTGNSGKYLTTDGANLSWGTVTSGAGTVTSVSVASANGFAGTVATATSTPAITISTTVTGLLKGNGTSISAAVAGTDYQGASTNLTSLAALSYASASFVKMTAAGTFALDTNTYYLSSNPSGYTTNTGTVTTVSITTANGVSGSVATATSTPAITLTLGAITPTSVNSVVISGSATPTLAVTGTSSISGSNTGDNATNSLYSGLVSNATHTGDATGATALTVVGLRGVALPTLGVTAGFLRYTGTGTNTWVFDSSTYLTANQSITLSGDISGTGSTAITTAIGANKVTNAMLAQVSTATFKGRTTAATGNVEDLTVTQATAMLNVFSSTLKGLAPASGGGTTNFLRADGTWAAPAAGGSAYSVISVSTTHSETATSGTKIIKADTTGGAFSVTLPTAVGNTATIIVKKVAGSGALTIDGNSTETIDGGLTAIINKVYESITLISDNSNWQIV